MSLRSLGLAGTRIIAFILHSLSGQKARLLHPGGELRFIEFIVLAYVDVARVLALRLAGRGRTQQRAAEESHLHIFGEAMDAEEPAFVIFFAPDSV